MNDPVKEQEELLDVIQGGNQTGVSLELRALLFGGFAGGVTALATYVLLQDKGAVSLFGELLSIGSLAGISATAVAVVGFLLSMYRSRRPVAVRSRYSVVHGVFTSVGLAFVHASIVLLLVMGGFYIVQDAFRGLLLDPYAATAIIGGVATMTGYALYSTAARLTSARVSTALAIFLVSGALTSMITSADPYWWQHHFSTLGGGGTLSAYAFNVTLIIAGVVMVSLADYVARDYGQIATKNGSLPVVRIALIRTLLALIGIFLAGVGLFVYNEHLLLHNIAASGTVVFFLLLLLGLPALTPALSKVFFVLSYGLMLVTLGFYYLFAVVKYFNLTTFELLAVGVVFTWLVLFIRQVSAILDDQQEARKGKTPHMERAGQKKKETHQEA